MPDPGLVVAASNLLGTLPGVTEEKTETHATFLIGDKIFAFTRNGGGMALKLPRERIAELVRQEDFKPLTMGKRTMKEWMLIDHRKTADYKKDLELFKEAMAFVAVKKATGKKK